MSPDLWFALLIGVFLVALVCGIGNTADWRDWGMVGLLVVFNGLALTVVRIFCVEYGWLPDLGRDLMYAWRLWVLIGCAVVFAGMARAIKDGGRPTWASARRLALVVAVNVFV